MGATVCNLCLPMWFFSCICWFSNYKNVLKNFYNLVNKEKNAKGRYEK